MKALLLIGHGALNKSSGASMIRHAAALKQKGVADFVTAGFLNFSQPTFMEALERCILKGAVEVTIQPYFLIDGYYVSQALPKLIQKAKTTYPELKISTLKPFGDHPALAELVAKRCFEARQYLDKTQQSNVYGLLIIAHGTPKSNANKSIYEVATRVQRKLKVKTKVGFMECNQPSIEQALDSFIQEVSVIVAVPFFLQSGSHVREDIPNIIAKASKRYSKASISLSHHLDFDEALLQVIEDRQLS